MTKSQLKIGSILDRQVQRDSHTMMMAFTIQLDGKSLKSFHQTERLFFADSPPSESTFQDISDFEKPKCRNNGEIIKKRF